MRSRNCLAVAAPPTGTVRPRCGLRHGGSTAGPAGRLGASRQKAKRREALPPAEGRQNAGLKNFAVVTWPQRHLMKTIRAIFRDGSFQPLDPVDLPENTRLTVALLDSDDLSADAFAE